MDYEAAVARLSSPTLFAILHAAFGGASEHEAAVSAEAVRKPFWAGFSVGFALTFAAALVAMKGFLASLFRRPLEKCRPLRSLVATGEPVKMALVVRKDLKMSNGKIAAQCAHAAVAIVEEILAFKSTTTTSPRSALNPASALWVQWYDAWNASGSSKVALQCPDEAAMMALAKHARQMNLPHYVIRDAGRTQVAPGSKTVVAVGPGPKSLVDEVTGQLKLL
ncbi:Peptidyl-tRNA hydrolase PTH2 family protein [Leishmania donovani]|uniref:peptidyl-tRNA hydrolase n=2 Tax=Leishmania donovani TaxID=5661 RepID=A0A3S7WPI5_LEIDO|nr:Peptidyl-tRNA hydrolase PTH2, putative [Leishmania donovani]TPP54819.1 Peptidyl-tRNA hydrolase PTH2 family protein [Leishmania donovani]